uniref:(northern house mosquito) hypothetical protein n=1 Tax=Culex pipiens TaxID=7175 RepID=A0A8D8A2E9_CULPI
MLNGGEKFTGIVNWSAGSICREIVLQTDTHLSRIRQRKVWRKTDEETTYNKHKINQQSPIIQNSLLTFLPAAANSPNDAAASPDVTSDAAASAFLACSASSTRSVPAATSLPSVSTGPNPRALFPVVQRVELQIVRHTADAFASAILH